MNKEYVNDLSCQFKDKVIVVTGSTQEVVLRLQNFLRQEEQRQ